MTIEPKIRFVEKSDLKDLVRLCKLHANFEECEYNSKDKKQKLNEHLFCERPTLYCLVVEYLDEIIGYATYMKQFSTWDSDFYIYMDCLFMTEKSRSLGIGEKLIEEIKTQAKKLNCDLIQWQTPDFNTRAMKFYNKIGGVSKAKERYFLKV